MRAPTCSVDHFGVLRGPVLYTRHPIPKVDHICHLEVVDSVIDRVYAVVRVVFLWNINKTSQNYIPEIFAIIRMTTFCHHQVSYADLYALDGIVQCITIVYLYGRTLLLGHVLVRMPNCCPRERKMKEKKRKKEPSLGSRNAQKIRERKNIYNSFFKSKKKKKKLPGCSNLARILLHHCYVSISIFCHQNGPVIIFELQL